MNWKKLTALALALAIAGTLCACGEETTTQTEQTQTEQTQTAAPETAAPAAEVTVTDMIGREVTVTPGGYKRVVCIGAGALRMYSYVCDTGLL